MKDGSEPTAAIREAFQRVEDAWDDDAAHRSFLALAATLDRLADAGRLYREVGKNDPSRADAAKKRLDAITLLALQSLETTRTPPRTRPPAWLVVLAIVVAVGLLTAAALSLLKLAGGDL